MIDLHAHFLPGVDDGPETFEQALAMCRLAAADGCTRVVATPHRRRDLWPDRRRAELARLAAELDAAAGAALSVELGAEVRVDSDLVAELDRGESEPLIPLGASRVVLLELEPRGWGPDPVAVVRELEARGWRSLIAHVEITPCLRSAPELVGALAAAGAALQVTAMSVTGELGRAPREAAAALFDAGLVHVVASDAHRPDWRPPGLARARAEIARRWGEEVAAAVTEINPAALLADRGAAPRARGAAR